MTNNITPNLPLTRKAPSAAGKAVYLRKISDVPDLRLATARNG